MFLLSCKITASPTTKAEVLVKWKNSLLYTPFLNSWSLSNIHNLCSTWDAVVCDKTTNTTVSEIYLSGFDLSGTLHGFDFASLPNLTHLDLNDNSFYGSIPPQIGSLSKLIFLDFGSNNFTGTVPYEIGHLRELEYLSFNNNSFNGAIPHQVISLPKVWYLDFGGNYFASPPHWSDYSCMPSLTYLDLSFNSFTPEFPSFIMKCHNLTFLDLSFNYFNGTIPESLYTNLVKLQFLNLSYCEMEGPLSSNLSKLSNLKELRMGNNNFSGVLPPNLCSGMMLSILAVNNNSFSGIFPNSLRNCLTLTTIRLDGNHFSGNITEALGVYPSLGFLDLRSNEFTGNIPHKFFRLANLIFLDLSNNNLSGSIPNDCETFNASSLKILNLSHNNLTGTIPQCLATLPSLTVLDLHMNNLCGTLPRIFPKGNVLDTIKLNGNFLEGALPKSLAHCTKLQVLDVGENSIEDTFPSWLGLLQELQVLILRANKFYGTFSNSSNIRDAHAFPKLRVFDVSNNYFSGSLPVSFLKNFQGMMNVSYTHNGLQYMSFTYSGYRSYFASIVVNMKDQSVELVKILMTFTTVDLSNNLLVGEIPQVIGELDSLKGLNLSHNRISGTIPQTLGNLRNLEWLDLSWNQLKGEIPLALTNLNFLSVLNVSQNQLEGAIPAGGQFNTFQNDSYVGNAMLCGLPLSKSCSGANDDNGHSSSSLTFEDEEKFGFGWKSVAVGYACGVVVGVLLGWSRNRMVLESAQPLEEESPQEEDLRLRSVKKAKPNGDESLPDADDNVEFVRDRESMIIENPNSSQGIQSSENKSTPLDGCGLRMKDPEQVSTYKDRLMSDDTGIVLSLTEIMQLVAEDYGLEEKEDVNLEEEAPFNPKSVVEVSFEEYDQWCKPWKLSLIVKLLGKSLRFRAMEAWIRRA
ncbi:hypothetical protein AHAS_Ahas18G0061700 [Arachis hypogaea]